MSPPAFFTQIPANAGFELWVVYLCWAAVIVVLYFLCRWYGDVKRRHPRALRYL
jgi:hypothetical protein